MKSCGTCRFMGRRGGFALCRRHAPEAIPGGRAVWPVLADPAGDWCGEWEAAPVGVERAVPQDVPLVERAGTK